MFKKSQRPVGTRSRGWTPLIIIVLALAGGALAQAVAPATSYQLANIASAFFLLLAAAVAFWQWMRFFPQSFLLRWSPLLVVGLGLAGVLMMYEIVGVDGELIPQLRRRSAPPVALPQQAQGSPELIAQQWTLVVDDRGYSGFLGRRRDGKLPHREFSTRWGQQPPELVWKQPIGAGSAGVAVARAVETQTDVVLDDSEQQPERWLGYTLEQREASDSQPASEWVSCYELSDGQLLWHHEEPGYHSHFLGDVGPRSTPTIDAAGRVFAQGATGKVWCLDGLSGELLWRVDLLEIAGISQEESEEHVLWGRSGSPLWVDDLVIVPLGGSPQQPAGTRSLIALDAASGETRWISGEQQISYASPVLATIAGVRQVLSVNQDSVSGTAVEDGKVLWTAPWPGKSNANASCSNPLPLPGDRVLLSKEYGGGAKLLQIELLGETWQASTIWEENRLLKTKFTNAVAVDPVAYGISNGTLECVDLENGTKLWAQGRRERFGHGHLLLVEDVLLSSTDTGEIALVALDIEGYQELGRFQAIEGKTWNPPTVLSNYVLLRNGYEMALWRLPLR
ncbi:PQQ-binding-like beta-propeller repeat protein [Planctomycetaceae bacterium SH139]